MKISNPAARQRLAQRKPLHFGLATIIHRWLFHKHSFFRSSDTYPIWGILPIPDD